ncbi:MAG: disulfide bond formation protein B [Pseudomonadota bacterium]
MLSKYEPWLTPRAAFLITGGICAALLASAHLFERVGGLVPCLLCLDQREVHWTALTVAGLGLVANLFGLGRMAMAAGLAALTLVLLWSTGLAGYHAGVEWDFWDGPMACASTAGAAPSVDVDPTDILGSLDSAGPTGPSCEEAAWRMFGISMAGYNALISLGLALFTTAAAWRLVRPAAPANIKAQGDIA